MSILIGVLEFGELVKNLNSLKDEPGIVAVFCQAGEEIELVELAETDRIRTVLERRRDRREWDGCDILFSVYYTGDADQTVRRRITSLIESEFDMDAAA
jgi:hypothetical protein